MLYIKVFVQEKYLDFSDYQTPIKWRVKIIDNQLLRFKHFF